MKIQTKHHWNGPVNLGQKKRFRLNFFRRAATQKKLWIFPILLMFSAKAFFSLNRIIFLFFQQKKKIGDESFCAQAICTATMNLNEKYKVEVKLNQNGDVLCSQCQCKRRQVSLVGENHKSTYIIIISFHLKKLKWSCRESKLCSCPWTSSSWISHKDKNSNKDIQKKESDELHEHWKPLSKNRKNKTNQ